MGLYDSGDYNSLLSVVERLKTEYPSIEITNIDYTGQKRTRAAYFFDKRYSRRGNVFLELWYTKHEDKLSFIFFKSLMTPEEISEADGNRRPTANRGSLYRYGMTLDEMMSYIRGKLDLYCKKEGLEIKIKPERISRDRSQAAEVTDKKKAVLDENASEEFAAGLPDEELREAAELRGKRIVSERQVTTIQRDRDPYVSEYAKRRAKGMCDLCHNPAPFMDSKGRPYLESHHVKWLSEGGSDIIENAVALCPNCHKKMHILNEKKDLESLYSRLEQYGMFVIA